MKTPLKLREKIKHHLSQQYEGIFSHETIEKHLEDHVGSIQSDALIERIKPFMKKGQKALDIGCGYGSFVLAARKNGYDCHGLEIEVFENNISKKRAEDEGVNPSIFTQGSALDLPYSDNDFDVITFWNVLEHIPDYKKALKEAKRVLKPKGKIFMVAPNYASFRSEAHYHVPWIPFFPKKLASFYLRCLGRDPSFLHECIFYITTFGVKRILRKLNFSISTCEVDKIKSEIPFYSNKLNKIVSFFEAIRVKKLFCKILFSLQTHPFKKAIDMTASKND